MINKIITLIKTKYKIFCFNQLIKNIDSVKKGSGKVLFWVPGGYVGLLNVEILIGLILKIRGFKTHFIICGGIYKACARRFDFPDMPVFEWSDYCRKCKKEQSELLEKFNMDYSYIGDYISDKKKKELFEMIKSIKYVTIKKVSYNGNIIGKYIYSSINRHTRSMPFENNKELISEFSYTALIVAAASESAINKTNPDRVYMSHGVYVDWGPALMNALNKKIPVISYVTSYLDNHFYFGTVTKSGETFQSIKDNKWKLIKKHNLTEKENTKLNIFINKRYQKSKSYDMKNILAKYEGNNEKYFKKYNINGSKPIWGIMTHITWDSVIDYFPMIHDDLDGWLLHTIQEIKCNKNVQWLIKIHPSEKIDNPDSGAQNLIENKFPELPEHVKLIKMDDDISPLDFYNLIDGGITVFGTGGLELSLMSKPVILAGKPHYANKGFTYDSEDRIHYSNMLKNAGEIYQLDKEKVELARKYAYNYFIQRQIPFNVVKNQFEIDYNKLNLIKPGKDRIIEFIYNHIIDGNDFILEEELINMLDMKYKKT